VYQGAHVDVVNHSTYANVTNPPLTGRGEMSLNVAADVNIVNNIFYSARGQNPVVMSNACTGGLQYRLQPVLRGQQQPGEHHRRNARSGRRSAVRDAHGVDGGGGEPAAAQRQSRAWDRNVQSRSSLGHQRRSASGDGLGSRGVRAVGQAFQIVPSTRAQFPPMTSRIWSSV
jgi:hypothetical protein